MAIAQLIWNLSGCISAELKSDLYDSVLIIDKTCRPKIKGEKSLHIGYWRCYALLINLSQDTGWCAYIQDDSRCPRLFRCGGHMLCPDRQVAVRVVLACHPSSTMRVWQVVSNVRYKPDHNSFTSSK